MSEDPYRPPKTDLLKDLLRRGSPVRAVATAVIFDLLCSLLLSVLLSVVYGAYLVSNGVSSDDLGDHMKKLDMSSPLIMFGALGGAVISFISGFLCARIVNYKEYQFAALAAVLTCLNAMVLDSGDNIPQSLFFALMTVASVVFGAHYYVVRKKAALADITVDQPPE